MNHALVVGGTGMLSNVSLWLVNKGYHISIISRNSEKMIHLIHKSTKKFAITPLLVDYTNEKELKQKLLHTIIQNGEIKLLIAWIHPYAKNALNLILKEIPNKNLKIFHILNSRSDLKQIKSKLCLSENYLYRQIQLGFIIDNDCSRWLTHEEISNGVIESTKRYPGTCNRRYPPLEKTSQIKM